MCLTAYLIRLSTLIQKKKKKLGLELLVMMLLKLELSYISILLYKEYKKFYLFVHNRATDFTS